MIATRIHPNGTTPSSDRPAPLDRVLSSFLNGETNRRMRRGLRIRKRELTTDEGIVGLRTLDGSIMINETHPSAYTAHLRRALIALGWQPVYNSLYASLWAKPAASPTTAPTIVSLNGSLPIGMDIEEDDDDE
jgi:hypothetical protein